MSAEINEKHAKVATLVVDELNANLKEVGIEDQFFSYIENREAAKEAWFKAHGIYKAISEGSYENEEKALSLMLICLKSKQIFDAIALNREFKATK